MHCLFYILLLHFTFFWSYWRKWGIYCILNRISCR